MISENLKVGDSIRCLSSSYNHLTKGKDYKIEELNSNKLYILDDSGKRFCVFREDFSRKSSPSFEKVDVFPKEMLVWNDNLFSFKSVVTGTYKGFYMVNNSYGIPYGYKHARDIEIIAKSEKMDSEDVKIKLNTLKNL